MTTNADRYRRRMAATQTQQQNDDGLNLVRGCINAIPYALGIWACVIGAIIYWA